MASLNERHRNNVRAGVFVTVSLIIALAVITILTDFVDRLRRSTAPYTVTFDVVSGVANLRRGSDVRVGGVSMGEVTDVRPKLVQGEAFREIEVHFEVDRRISIFADAQVVVSRPLIGSEAWLDIPSVGDPARGTPVQGRLVGTPSVGLLTSLLGSENASKTDQMMENARAFTELMAKLPDEYDTRLAPTLDDLRATAGDVRSVVGEFRKTQWPTWAQSVDRVLTWAAQATGQLDAAVAEGQGLLADSRALVAENRQSIRSIVSNVQASTDRLNGETIDKFHALLQTGQQSLDEVASAMQQLRMDYDDWATNIGEALANANLAAQQLKLTMIETRRSPWKVLYRPSSDELEHELLYEATRSFAVAAADLKAASASVQRVLEHHGDTIADDKDAYVRLKRNLLDSLANYEKAQQQMLDVLVSENNAK